MTPVIGVCGIRTRARYGEVWDREVTMLPKVYSAAVARAGGACLVALPDGALAARPELLLDRVDGLLLAGGADIAPSSYGAPDHPRTGPTDPLRDSAEIALTRVAIERGVPLLGICRGMEVLNVALGGGLVPHLPDALDGDRSHLRRDGEFAEHPVRIVAGTRTADLVGAEEVVVQSHHHQAVAGLGEGLRATAFASEGRVIEAVERPGGALVVGVQWHPEEDPSSTVIARFVAHAAASRS
ncbi:gamma-glutamyl-gamma-aminobutyrate hydrolase family protein [Tsukamurella sp. PLM1]|uniref:gamma-glutamyl-gamma-aminobutyrate hydrolase family protein n=1 Tax=Tsukamurella sp. PLM1 TaxID=2929795 RepID=UPI0020C096A2|nr:gamma-glutamyl-gamma-aminobutyrate hydrolase family protein [Tsukamurella sp. PLM1]